jgi:hypothetical protein
VQVLVSRCGHLDYLRFLLRLSNHGLEDGCFPFVKVVPVSAVTVRPVAGAKESCWWVHGAAGGWSTALPVTAGAAASTASSQSWERPHRLWPPPCPTPLCRNVDGELLPSNAVRMRVARGLVDVFARGVELVAPPL